MEVVLINKNFEIKNENSYAICLGIFDGVHTGHRKLIGKTVSLAKEKGLKSAVLTFISKNSGNRIYPLEMQRKIIEGLGIDTLFIIDFNDEFKKIGAEDFINNYIIKYLKAKEVVCGFNFRFGKDREGSTETLFENSTKGYNLTVIDKVEKNGKTVSSTLIKEYLKCGDVKTANSFLNSVYTVEGVIKNGAKIGRTINFPTANIPMKKECIPLKKGVYAVKVKIDGREFSGITNVGYAPTIRNTDEILTETHIFDFCGDLYNKYAEINFIDFIREEKKFENIEVLKSAIKADVEKAFEILEEAGC